jgi:hypothetical protein
MDRTLFESLQQGLKEAAAIRRGELAPGRVTEIGTPDAKSVPCIHKSSTWRMSKRAI